MRCKSSGSNRVESAVEPTLSHGRGLRSQGGDRGQQLDGTMIDLIGDAET
jgi:hypothetical protein